MSKYNPVTHVIFDMDGLLLDTERLYTCATQDLASEYGKDYSWDVKVKAMGRQSCVAATIIVDSLGLPLTVEEYLLKINDMYEKYFPQAQLLPDSVGVYLLIHQRILSRYNIDFTWEDLMAEMGHSAKETARHVVAKKNVPMSANDYRDEVAHLQQKMFKDVNILEGAERLVRHLHQHGVPIAIASGSSQPSYDLKTTNHKEFMTLFHHTVLTSSDPDVKQGKPAPDAFLVCARRFDDSPDPKNCLVFEDAPNGVQAAVAAGMQVVMVPDPRTTPEMTEGATLVLRSLSDFIPEEFGLPPYDDEQN